MKKKIKVILFSIVLLIIISVFLYIRFKSYNYEVSYTINSFKVDEIYQIKDNEYTFYIKNDKQTFSYSFNHKYIRNKELIDEIKLYEDNDEICILPLSDKIKFYPICYNNSEYTFYNLSNQTIPDFKYQKLNITEISNDELKINYIKDNKYLIYNYNSFYFIKDNKIKEIKLFEKDHYTLDLVYELNQYIILPNYDTEYYFNKFYVINMINGKIKEIEFNNKISFNSVFLGDYKNKIYLLDKKEEKEYVINIDKEKIEEIDFTILNNKKLEKVTFKEIINNNLKFDNQPKDNYEIIDNKLYQKINEHKILVTNKLVDKIIKEDKDSNTIYYLSKENLYMYNNIYGEILIMSNFEWNFNNTNVIYIYK